MTEEDYYSPISNRLKDMTKELSNAVMSVLAISSSARTLKKRRMNLDSELKEAINHLSTAFTEWKKLEEIVDFQLSHLDELNEQTLARLIEKAADSTMALEFVGQHGRLKEVRTAHAMISLDEELIPFSVKEVGTHSRETLEKWEKAISEFLKLQT